MLSTVLAHGSGVVQSAAKLLFSASFVGTPWMVHLDVDRNKNPQAQSPKIKIKRSTWTPPRVDGGSHGTKACKPGSAQWVDGQK
ncbi:hypothetical protein LZ32DRAFT_601009 [Colletotrichum eremochloae]|nr:hypothetical protein LZ32DRAFT_601009 [Colletotrichum eremochloae]